jgi:hypothetical protein
MPGRPKGHGFSPLIFMNRFEWDYLFLLSLAGAASILMSIQKKFDRPSERIRSLVSLSNSCLQSLQRYNPLGISAQTAKGKMREESLQLSVLMGIGHRASSYRQTSSGLNPL